MRPACPKTPSGCNEILRREREKLSSKCRRSGIPRNLFVNKIGNGMLGAVSKIDWRGVNECGRRRAVAEMNTPRVLSVARPARCKVMWLGGSGQRPSVAKRWLTPSVAGARPIPRAVPGGSESVASAIYVTRITSGFPFVDTARSREGKE